jgi:pimeloyl-ACP methyl ester carboxylesterase
MKNYIGSERSTMSSLFNKTIRLRDGRKFGFAEYGDPAGRPVFHFHGFPGSRIEGLFLDEVAQRIGVRVIVPDRPGMGLSTNLPSRKLVDWPNDVVELADALALQKFAVEGISGGGPYAAVCAWKIPERLTSATIIAGLGPLNQPNAMIGMKPGNIKLFTTAMKSPWKLYPALWLQKMQWKEGSMEKLIATMIEVDKEALRRSPSMYQTLFKSTKEAFRQGVRGVVRETLIYVKPWGFDLSEVRTPVYLWHGEADVNAPFGMGRYLSHNLPKCETHFFVGEGHYSLGLNHLTEIFEKIKNSHLNHDKSLH